MSVAVQVDHAIAEAIRQQKPVYISVCCNLPGLPYPTFTEVPVPFAMVPKRSNQKYEKPYTTYIIASIQLMGSHKMYTRVLQAPLKAGPCHSVRSSELPAAMPLCLSVGLWRQQWMQRQNSSTKLPSLSWLAV